MSCLQYPVNECPRASECITLPVWEGLYKAINNYLDSVTLQDIIDNSTGGDYSYFKIIGLRRSGAPLSGRRNLC